MKPSPRYDTSGLIEAQYELGSRGRVLRNKLGIKSKREMDVLEKQELIRTLEALSGMFDEVHRFTSADVCKIHREWLGRIYDWAGKYRQVKLGKGDFEFAFPARIPALMAEFEKNLLREYTPCRFRSLGEIIVALAVIHVASCSSYIPSAKATAGLPVCWPLLWLYRRGCRRWILAALSAKGSGTISWQYRLE